MHGATIFYFQTHEYVELEWKINASRTSKDVNVGVLGVAIDARQYSSCELLRLLFESIQKRQKSPSPKCMIAKMIPNCIAFTQNKLRKFIVFIDIISMTLWAIKKRLSAKFYDCKMHMHASKRNSSNNLSISELRLRECVCCVCLCESKHLTVAENYKIDAAWVDRNEK